jgi:hypothetical protein
LSADIFAAHASYFACASVCVAKLLQFTVSETHSDPIIFIPFFSSTLDSWIDPVFHKVSRSRS